MPAPLEDQPITRIGPLPGGGGSASVELVELGGRRLVLKRSSPARAAGERQFQQALAAAGLPSLALATHSSLGPGDLLLEFVEGSRTLGGGPPPARSWGLWGAAVAGMHKVRFAGFMRVDSAGEIVSGSWASFIDRLIGRALKAGRAADLPTSLLEEAESKLGDLRGFMPSGFSLSHGDLHANNVLLRGREAVLFDKAAQIWACPPVFDLALVYSVFRASRYGVSRPEDESRLKAFLAAYGDNIQDADWLDHFALANGMIRYPNPFVPEQRQIIEGALARL